MSDQNGPEWSGQDFYLDRSIFILRQYGSYFTLQYNFSDRIYLSFLRSSSAIDIIIFLAYEKYLVIQ